MGFNVEEAVRAKAYAEQQFMQKNFAGAKNFALKAQMLFPELEGISQMVATFSVYTASEVKINGEPDFYSILGLDPYVERSKIKKQYKKMAILLHPDKNKTAGADGAFRLVSEAWSLLSDNSKRSSYNQRRNMFSSSHGRRQDTFWTVCTSCHVQYEYLRKYVNKRLSCKNCRGVFVAVETGLGPHDGVFPYGNASSYGPCGVPCIPPTTGYNGASHARPPNILSFQSVPSNGLSSSSFTFYQANGEGKKLEKVNAGPTENSGIRREIPKPKRGRPSKKIKFESTESEAVGLNNNAIEPKLANRSQTRRLSAALALDPRQLLIARGRSAIHMKLEEMAREAEEIERRKAFAIAAGAKPQMEVKKDVVMSMTVPDSDFHDFDKDRSEECFKPKQIWALYDEEDGMPRLYCIIRDVISLSPFKIFISYLSSRSDTEFGAVNWLESGFTKSCGNFRVFYSEAVEQVNIFSHVLRHEKAGRGGCVRIYPRKKEIWAVYKKWSGDWDRWTPIEVRHQYEMVEVVDEYSDKRGVWVRPVVKVDGYKTVYRRSGEEGRRIPRREMLRFSHQVPSWPLEAVKTANLLEGCWDLDPAATPDEFLN